ncbi:MAG TPA: tetratricopeptide repeat protein [Polyangia bacterium]
MTRSACPSEDEALQPPGDAELDRHVATCPRCRATRDELLRAIALAKALPSNVPGAARREEVRASLLATAAAEPAAVAPRTSWAVGGIVAVAAVILALGLARGRRPPEPARSHVVVRPASGARYAIASPPPLETIRLWDGAIDLDVQPLGPGDRVRVEVGDGEIEVRGTRFQVAAETDRLVGVEVTHGRVEVRPRGAALATLGAGQRWRAAPRAAPERPSPPAELPVAEPPRAIAPRLRRVAARAEAGVARALAPTRQEALYDDAWDALRARRFDEAATGFGRVLAESPSGPLADEAGFWRAIALARGKKNAEAVPAFRAFLATYPASPRRGEASAILGWLFVDAHRMEEAAALFRTAAQDPHESVRASAREGLGAFARSSAGR